MIKYFILIVLFISILSGCSEPKEKLSNDKIEERTQTGERKSIHQEDSEKYSQEMEKKELSEKFKITIDKIESITDNSNGKFVKPNFTSDGKNIAFTTFNYNQIWIYNIEKKLAEKIIELPQCGNEYQISDDGNQIYFRNRARNGKRKGGTYSIFVYSITERKLDLLYSSEKRISVPKYLAGNLYFTEDEKPKKLDLLTNKVDENFSSSYFYVNGNKLIKLHNRVDTISVNDSNFKFIKCDMSRNGKFVSTLTANNGVLVLDNSGKLVRQFSSALSLDLLHMSNLVVYTEETDDGSKILSSKMVIGFTNSEKTINISEQLKESAFNPKWSFSDNRIVFNTEDGLIKVISLKVEKI